MALRSIFIENPNNFGQRLSNIRRLKGFSQIEVANKLKLAYSTYNSWENGVRLPKINSLKILANLFEIPVDFLTTEKSLTLDSKTGKIVLAEKVFSDGFLIPYMKPSFFTISKKFNEVLELSTKYHHQLFLNNEEQYFAFIAYGHSMSVRTGISINDQDIVICSKIFDTNKKFKGDLYVLSILNEDKTPQEAIIRAVETENDSYILTPFNESYETKKVHKMGLILWGLCLQVVRNIDLI